MFFPVLFPCACFGRPAFCACTRLRHTTESLLPVLALESAIGASPKLSFCTFARRSAMSTPPKLAGAVFCARKRHERIRKAKPAQKRLGRVAPPHPGTGPAPFYLNLISGLGVLAQACKADSGTYGRAWMATRGRHCFPRSRSPGARDAIVWRLGGYACDRVTEFGVRAAMRAATGNPPQKASASSRCPQDGPIGF